MSVYGFCPECGARGVNRERRPDGNDTCLNGHSYPSAIALEDVSSLPDDDCDPTDIEEDGE